METGHREALESSMETGRQEVLEWPEEADHLGGSGGADGPDTEEANLRRRKSQGAPPVTQAPRST